MVVVENGQVEVDRSRIVADWVGVGRGKAVVGVVVVAA